MSCFSREAIEDKKQKVKHYMKYAREVGASIAIATTSSLNR